jgi:hypothetical protein
MLTTPNQLPAPPGKRDLRIDFWRGLCIVGMVAWHLLTDPSYPRWFSFPIIQAFNFVAEGFVLLAGTVVGLRLAKAAVGPLTPWGYWRRAVSLLLVHYAVVASLIVLFQTTDLFRPYSYGTRVTDVASRPWQEWLSEVLLLRYQPYLGDILTVFVFCFAAMPLFLLLLRGGGSGGLLAVSVAVYLVAVRAPDFCPINGDGAFVFNSWQLYFVLGLLFGQHYQAVVQSWEANTWRYLVPLALCLAVAAANRLGLHLRPGWKQSLPLFLLDDRKPLTPFRTFYILTYMLLIALLTVRCWSWIADTRPVRWLSTFGAHSLAVFVASVFLDYLLKGLLVKWDWRFPLNLLALAVEIVLLYVLARLLARREAPSPPQPSPQEVALAA